MKSRSQAILLSSALVVLLLICSSVVLADSETETETQTTRSLAGSQAHLSFSLVPSPPPAGASYPQGNGSATVEVQGTLLVVHLEAEGMKGGVHLTLEVVANGTSRSVADMTASGEGDIEAEAAVSLSPGTYSVGLQVLDSSTFTSPTVVLTSSPQTQTVSIGPASQPASTTSTESTQQVSTVHGGETEDEGISAAIKAKVIPAVVDVGQSGSSVHVNDGNFSVSIGQFDGGYLVSVSGANVTGPRVLLINLTSSQSRSLLSAPVSITLDGSAVQQAGSVQEVLGAKAADPARFILVSNPSALTLLISVPHFSYHTIQILPIVAQAISALAVDLPVLVLGVAAVSVLVLTAYTRRTRFVH